MRAKISALASSAIAGTHRRIWWGSLATALVLGLAGALLLPESHAGQGGGISSGAPGSLRYGTAIPGSCVTARGQVFFKTVGPNAGVYQCLGNAFAQLAGAGSTVTSFNTRTGAVTLTGADVSELLSVTDLSTYATASGTGSTAVLATFTGLASGHVLTWNGSNWINQVASGGVTTLNTLTAATQTFAVGTSGTDFGISSATSTHTFNLPDASPSARGVVNTGAQEFAGAKTFDYVAGSSFIWKRSTNRFAINGNLDAFVAAAGARIGWMSGSNADANAFPIFAFKSTVSAGEVEFTDGDVGRGRGLIYGLRVGVVSVTGTYAILSTDFVVRGDATAGAFTATLPLCVAGNVGQVYTVVKTDASANAVTVGRAGSDVINGAASVSLAAQYNNVSVVCGAAGLYYKISL